MGGRGLASHASLVRARRPGRTRFRPHVGGFGFRERGDTIVFSTRQVVERESPILLVIHDENGGWQFLCATTTDVRDGVEVPLGRMLEAHPELRELADLPRGWVAERPADRLPWLRQPIRDEVA